MANQLTLFTDQDAVDDISINGMVYSAGLLSSADQCFILAEVDARSWKNDLKRRVQHYGYEYNYRARKVDRSMRIGDLPDFAINVADRMMERGLLPRRPDQLIVNEYMPGQGITAHIDCEPCFDETIAMVSLGWAYEMDFIHGRTNEIRSILLGTGSALVISGEARHDWLHQIKARKSDRGIARQRRVSLTFRNVILVPEISPGSKIPCSDSMVASTP